MKFLIGSDPELFLMKDGKFVSAHGVIAGDKANPFRVDRGAVQVDGMAVEFNTDPAGTEGEFLTNVQVVMRTLEAMCKGYDVVAVPVADFGAEYIAAQPDEAKELGCDPDYNAYTGLENVKPDVNLPFRTASGHVHIGWGEDIPDDLQHRATCEAVSRQMDFFLGLPSLFYDNDTRRREMYGKAGAFRPKSYGVEYRTLSNAWLKSEDLIKWVFRNAQRGVMELMEGNDLFARFGDIQEIINTSNKKEAERIIVAAGLEVI